MLPTQMTLNSKAINEPLQPKETENEGVCKDDQVLRQILSMCTRCEKLDTDDCDQEIYMQQQIKSRHELIPNELISDQKKEHEKDELQTSI